MALDCLELLPNEDPEQGQAYAERIIRLIGEVSKFPTCGDVLVPVQPLIRLLLNSHFMRQLLGKPVHVYVAMRGKECHGIFVAECVFSTLHADKLLWSVVYLVDPEIKNEFDAFLKTEVEKNYYWGVLDAAHAVAELEPTLRGEENGE